MRLRTLARLVFGATVAYVLLVALTGCAGAAQKALAARNRYHFAYGEYERRCGGTDSPECRAWNDDLSACATRIEEADAAIVRGGKLPDQLAAMETACKAALR